MASAARLDLDGNAIKPMTICMIGAGGFIGSHLCEKLMAETMHKVLAVDVYNDKIRHLLEPAAHPWSDRIQFHRINIKHDSRLEGLIKMADLVRDSLVSISCIGFWISCILYQFVAFSLVMQTVNLAAICTPADYNTRPLDTIYSNFIDALPVVCCWMFVWIIFRSKIMLLFVFLFLGNLLKLMYALICVLMWLFRWNTVQKTTSVSFTSRLVKSMGKRLGAFFPKIHLSGRWDLSPLYLFCLVLFGFVFFFFHA